MPRHSTNQYAGSFGSQRCVVNASALGYNEGIEVYRELGVQVRKFNVSKTPSIIPGGVSFRLTIERPSGMTAENLQRSLMDFEGTYMVEEL